MSNFPLFPAQASSLAGQVDALYFALVAISGFFAVRDNFRNPPDHTHLLKHIWMFIKHGRKPACIDVGRAKVADAACINRLYHCWLSLNESRGTKGNVIMG